MVVDHPLVFHWDYGVPPPSFSIPTGFQDKDSFLIFSDKTVGMYDTVTCQRIKRLKGHTGYVNSCSPGPSRGAPLVASASDDCSIKIWDTRHR